MLTVGVCLIFGDLSIGAYYSIFFLLSFFMLNTFRYGDQYFVNEDNHSSVRAENFFLVVGQKISPEKVKDIKEENYFRTIESSKKIARIFFNLILYFSQIVFLKYFDVT
jgi:hypothetical protein